VDTDDNSSNSDLCMNESYNPVFELLKMARL